MIRPDPEIERMTLKLRDAFRVFAWQMFKISYTSSDLDSLNTLHSKFYGLWRRSRVAEMDFFQLKSLAIQKGFSIEDMLEIRAHYYGLNNE